MVDAATYKARQDAAARQGGVDWNGIGNTLFGTQKAYPASNPGMMGRNPTSGFYNPGAVPQAIPGTAYGSNLLGKNQATFGGDNPNQVGYPASPYGGWVDDGSITPLSSTTVFKEKQPVSLTVRGSGMDEIGRGTSFADVLKMRFGPGADPGMEGAPGFGNVPMSPGIPPQGPPPAGIEPTRWAGATPQNGVARSQPALPFSGWAGAQHNGASTFAPRYSSGGYMFDAGGVQIGRDPRGVIQQTYGGTPQAMAAAQRRDRLTAPSGGSSYQDSQDRLSTLYNR